MAGCAGTALPQRAAVVEQRVELSPLALRLEHVRRLREAFDESRRGEARRIAVGTELVDALVDLCSLHRAAALRADAGAASLPAPHDLGARRAGEAAGAADAEVESDEPPAQDPEAPALARAQSPTFTSLAPAARAHTIAADRCALEAIAVINEIFQDESRHRDGRRLLGAQARLLGQLGQHTAARATWWRVLRRDARDALDVEAWLAFAAAFAADSREPELSAALTKAADIAFALHDTRLLEQTCERARALRASAAPAPCRR